MTVSNQNNLINACHYTYANIVKEFEILHHYGDWLNYWAWHVKELKLEPQTSRKVQKECKTAPNTNSYCIYQRNSVKMM